MHPRLLAPLAALLLAPSPVAAESELSIQEVLLRAKPAVALVVSTVESEVTLACPGGMQKVAPPATSEMGSGWFASPDGWLVTNAHVVLAAHRLPESVRRRHLERAARPGCRAVDAKLRPSVTVVLPNGTRLSARVAKVSGPPAETEMSGQDLALLRVQAGDLPTLPLADPATVKIGDPLHIIGFPGVVLGHELLAASARVEASVTGGSVSGFREDRAGHPVIQTDAPAAWGNSGGPAVDRHGRVLGVLTFVAESEAEQESAVQGFNFVIPVRTVRKFLEDAGVRVDGPGRFDEAWHAGLRQFFQGSHAAAALSLERADRLLPGLPDVVRLAAENREKVKHPPPRPFPWAWLGAALTALGATGYGALLAARRRRDRYRIRPAEVVRLMESAEPPVVLDVRDAAAYSRSPFRIPGALHVPAEALAGGLASVPVEPDRAVVAYCT